MSWVEPQPQPIPEGYEIGCDQCGVCCRSHIVEITGHDLAREPRLRAVARPLDPDLWADRPNHPDRPYGLACGSCPLQQANGACSIYETRPRVCRDYEPGGYQCREVRVFAGLPEVPLVPIVNGGDS